MASKRTGKDRKEPPERQLASKRIGKDQGEPPEKRIKVTAPNENVEGI